MSKNYYLELWRCQHPFAKFSQICQVKKVYSSSLLWLTTTNGWIFCFGQKCSQFILKLLIIPSINLFEEEKWKICTFFLYNSWKNTTTGCPTKNDTLFWRAVAPLNFELGIKVGVFWNSQVLSFKLHIIAFL